MQLVRWFERARARGGKRRPARKSGRLHCGEAGLDVLAPPLARRRPALSCTAAAARTEHHFLRLDRRLAVAVAGKEGAVDRQRRDVSAASHQRDHRGPCAARRMLQPGMEAERRRRWNMQAARAEIPIDHCAGGRTAKNEAEPEGFMRTANPRSSLSQMNRSRPGAGCRASMQRFVS